MQFGLACRLCMLEMASVLNLIHFLLTSVPYTVLSYLLPFGCTFPWRPDMNHLPSRSKARTQIAIVTLLVGFDAVSSYSKGQARNSGNIGPFSCLTLIASNAFDSIPPCQCIDE
jgi:hypothetical protein